ncbi:hypothetical protein ACHQM5_007763 [Ranunculus cassubicifolius]
MKPLMEKLTTENQSTFVPGRSISDNLLLAHELVRSYSRKAISKRCALKIDIHKAFDTLEWESIWRVLRKFNFSEKFITWVNMCYFTLLFDPGEWNCRRLLCWEVGHKTR